MIHRTPKYNRWHAKQHQFKQQHLTPPPPRGTTFPTMPGFMYDYFYGLTTAKTTQRSQFRKKSPSGRRRGTKKP